MRLNGVYLQQCSTEELVNASFSFENAIEAVKIKRNESRKFQKKMKNQPPPVINPAMTELLAAINIEILNRKNQE